MPPKAPVAPAAAQNEDPLIAELNGALARSGDPMPVKGDKFGEQPPSLADALETKPSPHRASSAAQPAPRAVLADKTHAKAAGGHGYRVVVKGEFYAKSSDAKGKVIKPYVLPFNLPALTNSKGESALGIIVGESRPGGGLLMAALRKMDPMVVKYRTHEIESVTPLQGAPEPTSVMYMSMDALKDYVRRDLPDFPTIDDLDEYHDVAHLREDVIDFKTNMTTDVVSPEGAKVKGGFGLKKTSAERIKERFLARKDDAELAAMNEGLELDGEEQP